MNPTIRHQRRYDHRLRELVCQSKSVDVAVRHGVPRSTARGCLAPATRPVVTLNSLNQDGLRRLALAHACQRAIGLTQRPPLETFLAQKDEILADEEFPDENKYYAD